jgi:peptidoglycan hydrolase-like protein with peptidoglycan-binding domain
VTAVQNGLHVPATGVFDTRTVSAVRAFQRRHPPCRVTGAMNPRTWRALLAATR